MVAGNCITVRHKATRLTYRDACQISRQVLSRKGPPMVLIDLKQSPDTTTAALARLVVLRRDLLGAGRDLRLAHLNGKCRSLYEIAKLAHVLPTW